MISIGKIANKIETRRQSIIAAIKRLRRDDPFATADRALIVEPGTDAAELFGHEQAVVLEDKLKKDLKEIEYALVKIKKETYGICERGGERIEAARLIAKPTAIYCLKCEREVESGKK